jgi:cell division protein FtsA
MKLRYASAYTDNSDIDNTLNYPIDQERSVESRKFVEIVEARLTEIIDNVWYQVPSEFADKLLGGIILTGGGSNMKNIEKAFRNITHIDKIRVAKFVNQTITSNQADITAHNATMNTILGLLAKGDLNCAGAEINANRDIFSPDKPAADPTTTADLHATPRSASDISGKGVVLTQAEKEKAEEEKHRKEEEERQRLIEEEEQRRKESEERRKNSVWGKAWRSLKSFGSTIMEPDEE